MRLTLIFCISILLFSCKKGEITPYAVPYKLEEPSHFPKMQIPLDNPLTVQGVELGRRLFYDKKLSADNSLSCAGCHLPQVSFSDPERYSTGIDGIKGTRNSMALVNLGYQKFFFWDGRAKTLEEQILEPVPNPIEMHQTWKNALIKLRANESYRKDFYAAFGSDQFDEYTVAKAIAQFLRTMISGFSKYDMLYKQINGYSLNQKEQSLYNQITIEEKAGYDLFLSLNGGDCVHCHTGPLMQLNIFANNGLDATFTDLGKGGVSGLAQDMGMFKVPTLRNIAQTAPYMHDGRFQTLDQVIEHYSSGIVMSPTISPAIEFASQGGVQLDAFEKGLIKKFLLTLTDEEFLKNPKFAPPN
jgi:cytochrome c peroxidase